MLTVDDAIDSMLRGTGYRRYSPSRKTLTGYEVNIMSIPKGSSVTRLLRFTDVEFHLNELRGGAGPWTTRFRFVKPRNDAPHGGTRRTTRRI